MDGIAPVKTLILMRHAKSDWADPALPDHDRPLAPRGLKAAPRMAAWLRRARLGIDHVWCSTARRACQTLAEVVAEIDGLPPFELRRELYLAGMAKMLAVVRETPADASCCLLVAHNPDMETLALWLTGNRESEQARAMMTKFPTGAVAVIDFMEGGWADVGQGTGDLRAFVTPKSLG